MITILHVIDSLRGGGKERQLIELLKSLEGNTEINNEIVLLKNINDYPDSEKLSCTFHIFDRKIKKDPTIIFKLRKLIKVLKPDIIHSWGTMPSVYSLPFINKERKLLNFMIQNGICKRWSPSWIRSKLTFPFSAIVMANSFAGIESYPTPAERSRVIYNGVHLARFDNLTPKKEIRQKFNIKTKYCISMVGAFHPRKDYFTYVRAAQKILNFRDDVTFLAIGDGVMQQEIKSLVPVENGSRILFLGRQNDVESINQSCDIGILTSNPDLHREGISNSIIEYMAAGLPVIATGGGGTPEIIDHCYSGFVIPPRNVDFLVDKIQYLLENDAVRLKFGKRGKTKVYESFTIENMTNQFIELYHSMVED